MKRKAKKLLLWLSSTLFVVACAAQPPQTSAYHWTTFVQTAGQPEPVPAEWVSTPEGKFAHSIVVPNPVPKDSGYRARMTSVQYFDHLCKSEAGEFIYKTVDNIAGFYFMRPPARPTDEDLKDRHKLEAPPLEAVFQVIKPDIEHRAVLFTSPPWRLYKYVEEPVQSRDQKAIAHASGYVANVTAMRVTLKERPESTYGLTWRGIRRVADRENGLAGGEWIVMSLETKEVMGVLRDYGRTGGTPNVKDGTWWLSAESCPNVLRPRTLVDVINQLYEFTAKVLRPVKVAR